MKLPIVKEIFLSSTRRDMELLRDEIAQILKKSGIRVIRFENPDFFQGDGGNMDDACLRRAQATPNMLLIVGTRAGVRYQGQARKVFRKQKLTITHAEARSVFARREGWYCFIREEVLIMYKIWASNRRKSFGRQIAFPGIDTNVFQLVHDIVKSRKSIQLYSNELALKGAIRKLFQKAK